MAVVDETEYRRNHCRVERAEARETVKEDVIYYVRTTVVHYADLP